MKFIDLHQQYLQQQQGIDKAINSVLHESNFIMGRQVKELEDILKAYVGMPYAVACASGTEALELCLMALGIKAGDEVITTPFTFMSTVEVIIHLGAVPVFVDISPDTFNINAQLIRDKITKKTKGIIAVDIFGQPADFDSINQIASDCGLFVIEDAAQSFGAIYKGRKACSLAPLSCTSFFPAKPLGCYGDGGMVFVQDELMAKKLSSLRVHGVGSHKYEHVHIGLNSRLDTLQAAILLEKFNYYPQEILDRQFIALKYSQALGKIVKVPFIAESNSSVYAQYNILCDKRDQLQEYLQTQDIPTAVYYPIPLHLQPVLKSFNYKLGDFPVSEYVSKHICALPFHAYLKDDQQQLVIEAIQNFLRT